jgi:hypothetical protein
VKEEDWCKPHSPSPGAHPVSNLSRQDKRERERDTDRHGGAPEAKRQPSTRATRIKEVEQKAQQYLAEI